MSIESLTNQISHDTFLVKVTGRRFDWCRLHNLNCEKIKSFGEKDCKKCFIEELNKKRSLTASFLIGGKMSKKIVKADITFIEQLQVAILEKEQEITPDGIAYINDQVWHQVTDLEQEDPHLLEALQMKIDFGKYKENPQYLGVLFITDNAYLHWIQKNFNSGKIKEAVNLIIIENWHVWL